MLSSLNGHLRDHEDAGLAAAFRPNVGDVVRRIDEVEESLSEWKNVSCSRDDGALTWERGLGTRVIVDSLL